MSLFGAHRGAGLEEAAFLGRGPYQRQGGRCQCRPFHGRARRGYDHRGRRFARAHDIAATACRGRDPPRTQGRRVAHQRAQGVVLM
jgi:hypothetical protein